MVYIFLSLVTGIFLGFFRKNYIEQRKIDKLINVSLFMLLFLMGFKLGVDERVLKNISHIGFKAAMLCIFSIAGSLLILKGVEKKIYEPDGNDSGNIGDY
ncbi:LysO family transporter [Thermovenabulum sp.]|uniref:LysO family transporter n=1 Tax=Thermovenabulum sp. TaxID=3100335 RepID=UPI003C7BD1E4